MHIFPPGISEALLTEFPLEFCNGDWSSKNYFGIGGAIFFTDRITDKQIQWYRSTEGPCTMLQKLSVQVICTTERMPIGCQFRKFHHRYWCTSFKLARSQTLHPPCPKLTNSPLFQDDSRFITVNCVALRCLL